MSKFTLKRALQFAVTTEAIGARAYRQLAQKLKNDQELAGVFKQLARDEAAHEKYFRSLLEKTQSDSGPKDYDEGMGVLKAMSLSEFFSTRAGLKKDLEAIKTRDQALNRAFELDQATLNYYRALKDVIPRGGRALDDVIAAEKQHLLKVMQYLITGARFRGLSDSH